MFGETFAIIFIVLLVGGIIFAICGYYIGWNSIINPPSSSGGMLHMFGLSQPTQSGMLSESMFASPLPVQTTSTQQSSSMMVGSGFIEPTYRGDWNASNTYGLRDIVTKYGKLYISEKVDNTENIYNESLLFPSYDRMKFISANGEYGNQFTLMMKDIEVNAIRVAVGDVNNFNINFFSLRYLNDSGTYESLYKSNAHVVEVKNDKKWIISPFPEPIVLPAGRPIVVTVMARKLELGYKEEVNSFSETIKHITQVVIFSPRTVIPEESVYFVVEPLIKRNSWRCLS